MLFLFSIWAVNTLYYFSQSKPGLMFSHRLVYLRGLDCDPAQKACVWLQDFPPSDVSLSHSQFWERNVCVSMFPATYNLFQHLTIRILYSSFLKRSVKDNAKQQHKKHKVGHSSISHPDYHITYNPSWLQHTLDLLGCHDVTIVIVSQTDMLCAGAGGGTLRGCRVLHHQLLIRSMRSLNSLSCPPNLENEVSQGGGT